MSSISFDRIAERYDQTRGGEHRARGYASTISPWLGRRVLEAGIGTGIVAKALTDLGHEVVGFDLSPAMLAHAQARLPGRVVVGDGYAPPIRPRSVASALTVWVLQLVPDPAAFVASVAGLLAPGGRYAVVLAAPEHDVDDLAVVEQLHERLRGRHRSEQVVAWGEAAGLHVAHLGSTPEDVWSATPNEIVALIESRTWSTLWDLDDARWAELVQPTIDALHALPDPDRPRRRQARHPLVVLER